MIAAAPVMYEKAISCNDPCFYDYEKLRNVTQDVGLVTLTNGAPFTDIVQPTNMDK